MNTYIKIKTSFVGYHKWKEAPEEVSFLKNLHRHNFLVEVVIPVTDLDRELEFFIIKNKVDKMIYENITGDYSCQETDNLEFSCEQMAKIIYDNCSKTIKTPKYVEVSEDNENSGIYGDY